MAGLCLIPFLNSAPQLLWLGTGAGICLRLYPGPPFLSAHLLSLFAPQPFLWENPARGIYWEDNVQRSSLHSFYISDFYFFLINEYGGVQLLQQKVGVELQKKILCECIFNSILKLGGVTLAAGIQSAWLHRVSGIFAHKYQSVWV